MVLTAADMVLLYRNKEGLSARRQVGEKLSNGDENQIQIHLENRYPFAVWARVMDELPVQFQVRDFEKRLRLEPGKEVSATFTLRPVRRGEYEFGHLRIFTESPLGLVRRRYTLGEPITVPVYPSFIQMRRYELIAFAHRGMDAGMKKMRRLGHSMEFDRIKEYVRGDDVRALNWKATARAGTLMVNTYREERSQPVYQLIDTGRVMKMPFEQMHLLDHAINTGLVISNIVLLKEDKAGTILFSNRGADVVPAEKGRAHIRRIQEALYRVETNFLESDFDKLLLTVRRTVPQRSLLLLYTNFESKTAMERRLPQLRNLARHHLLVVIFFVNTELDDLLERAPSTKKEIYVKTLAEQFDYEKREIAATLNRYGIQTILTRPEDLSINTLNKYLELKARGAL